MTTQPISLCQVKEGVSCGACCGLYNVPAQGKGTLECMLRWRAEEMERTPRTFAALDAFAELVLNDVPDRVRPLPAFHHCPFLGLIGEERDRPGCLLHPEAPGNRGVDYRGLSHYGGAACRLYFCPSHYRLEDRLQRIVLQSATDWYLYGVVITEHRLLRALIQGLEGFLGRPVAAEELSSSRNGPLVRELLALKLSWPYRRGRASGVCHYVFEDGLYERPEVGCSGLQEGGSRYERIFRELESSFGSAAEMLRAEAMLDDLFLRLAAEIRTYSKWDSSSS